MKEYKPGTFDRRIAYGQRDRKLMLVARGIIDGFKVRCQSDKEAKDLAYAFRIRARRVDQSERARYGLRVRLDARTIYVTRKAVLRR